MYGVLYVSQMLYAIYSMDNNQINMRPSMYLYEVHVLSYFLLIVLLLDTKLLYTIAGFAIMLVLTWHFLSNQKQPLLRWNFCEPTLSALNVS